MKAITNTLRTKYGLGTICFSHWHCFGKGSLGSCSSVFTLFTDKCMFSPQIKSVAPKVTFATRGKTVQESTFASKKLLLDNPLDGLQHMLQVPLLDEKEHVFSPAMEEIELAQKIFLPENNDVQYLGGFIKTEYLPRSEVPEVAFIGRSNVGKSSLIKELLFDAQGVKIPVSKKPGHTRVLHYFKVKNDFTLVDMPGYGHNMPPHYVQSAEQYLQSRQSLVRTFLLIDGKVGVTDIDKICIEMLEEFGKAYVVILTKIDKPMKSRLLKNVLHAKDLIRSNMSCCFPQPFLVSSHTSSGVAYLRAFIAYITGTLELRGH